MATRVTVVVLAYRTAIRLQSCIAAISSDPYAPAMELRVLLNDVPQSETRELQKQYPHVRWLSAPVNLGFAAGCNYAVRGVTTEFIAFINDDAVPAPGWLRELLACASRAPDAGAVGSRIVFPDGRLQEAGSVVWRDGSTAPIGRGLLGTDSSYNSTRRVDYCSANGLLVRTADWQRAGGFDEEYYPAYYEDVDFCFTLRHRLGRYVVYEPRSVIRHAESSSSSPAFRAFLFSKHRARFVTKWEHELQSYLNPAEGLAAAELRARGARARVLIIDDRLPDYSLGSGFGRFIALADEAFGSDYALTFVTTAQRQSVSPYLQDRGIETITVDALDTILKRDRFRAIIVSRPHNYTLARSVLRRQPHVVKIYDAEALFYVRLRREAENEPARVRELHRRAERTFSEEKAIVKDADLVICTSEEERRTIEGLGARRTALQLPLDPKVAPTTTGYSERDGVLFAAGWLGGNSSPNVNALEWLVRAIMPLVWAHDSTVQLFVTGANPPAEAQALTSERVTFTGRVENMRPLHEKVRVAVAPMLVGAGTKVKTIEALQYGVPVVATRVGAEGLPKIYDVSAIEVTDEASLFATAILRLHSDVAIWNRRRQEALELGRTLLDSRPNWLRILSDAVPLETATVW